MSGSSAIRLAVTAFALLVGGCDLSGEQMQHGRVLDQDTGEPIAGAIVVGRYMGGISWGGSSCNRAESAVSDAQGWFELPVDSKDGTPLMEAYKRGYDRGNPTRHAYLANAWTREWRISVLRWDESNLVSQLVVVEPEIYRTETSAKAASGEDVNVHLRVSRGPREERLRQLRLFQADCAGRSRTTVGLVPFIEGILSEQMGLGEREDVLDITRSRLERARDNNSPTSKRTT